MYQRLTQIHNNVAGYFVHEQDTCHHVTQYSTEQLLLKIAARTPFNHKESMIYYGTLEFCAVTNSYYNSNPKICTVHCSLAAPS